MYSLLPGVAVELDGALNPSLLIVGDKQVEWSALLDAIENLRTQLLAAHPEMMEEMPPTVAKPDVTKEALEVAYALLHNSSILVGMLR